MAGNVEREPIRQTEIIGNPPRQPQIRSSLRPFGSAWKAEDITCDYGACCSLSSRPKITFIRTGSAFGIYESPRKIKPFRKCALDEEIVVIHRAA
jgi:hypothetical protein